MYFIFLRFNKKSRDYALLLPQPFQDLNQAYNIANVKKKNYKKGVLELRFKGLFKDFVLFRIFA